MTHSLHGGCDPAEPGPNAGGSRAESGSEPIPLPVEDTLDLHAFAPRDIPGVVQDYLGEAAAHGFAEVRLIHGKGIGFQRERVRQVLAAHPLVEWFGDAPAGRGHWGATLVRLRAEGDGASPESGLGTTGGSPPAGTGGPGRDSRDDGGTEGGCGSGIDPD